MSLTAKEFKEKVVGNKYDIDGTAGVQCVDLFKYFCKLQYGSYCSTGTGYAEGFYLKRKTNGLLNKFNDIGSSVSSLKNGDWVFWGTGSKVAPKSHVAMYYDGKFVTQNAGGSTQYKSISTTGVIGILRYKEYATSSTSSSNSTSSKTTTSTSNSNKVIYTVKSGDTLSTIAKKYNTTWKAIYNDNKSTIDSTAKKHGITKNYYNYIYAGTKLTITKK